MWQFLKQALQGARWNRQEMAGSLGDLGTFIPLLVGMTIKNGLDFTSALFFAGFFNVLTGLIFTIPMAVQPMKAIAVIAISEGLTVSQVLAAGLLTSAVVLILGVTNLIDVLNRLIPKSVVRGIQLALGFTLLFTGVNLVADTQTLWGADSIPTGVGGFLLVLVLFNSSRWPPALILFILGLTLAIWSHPASLAQLSIGVNLPHIVTISPEDFRVGFLKAALPQIPLTTLNSVIAVCALSRDLFPGRPAAPRPVAISVGFMNLLAGWFGAMPMCHGAGGLAGQYRFGARTNGSILFLGATKIFLAVVFGNALLSLLQVYPNSILGVLLMVSGLELALVTRDMTARTDAFVMLLTAGISLALKSPALGFVAGFMLSKLVYKGILQVEETREDKP
ncbi:MAG TPA: putative sulfate/molybdate transporter [Candidatus Hypogeohydataceae bacterium YC38]